MLDKINGTGFFVASSFKVNKDTYFSGWMGYENSIVIGERGYDEYLKKNDAPSFTFLADGRFSLCHVNNETVEARTDLFGQETLYYYARKGVWALSNSFILLCRHLIDFGAELTLDSDQANLLKIKHGFSQHLISNDTLVNEIKVSPRDKILIIKKESCEAYFKDFNVDHMVKNSSYVDNLLSFSQRVSDINRSLANFFRGRITVDITGGVDSRMVLATLVAADIDLSDINFVCAKGEGDDYHVALLLAEKFGFDIKNKSFTYGQGGRDELYDLWKIGNLGVYSPVYFPRSARPQKLVHFHGACGECFRDFYQSEADSFLEKVASTVNDSIVVASLNRKFGKSLRDIGEPVNSKMAMIRHYFNFRSRFHFGRSAFRNLNDYIVSPLSSPYLLCAFEKLSNDEKERGVLVLDIFLALCPDLLNVPFDDENKNFSKKDIVESRLHSVAKKKKDSRELDIYYIQEPRVEKTNEGRPIIEYMLDDLYKYQDIVLASGYYSGEEIESARKAIIKEGRQTMLAQEASKIISLGEVLTLCSDFSS